MKSIFPCSSSEIFRSHKIVFWLSELTFFYSLQTHLVNQGTGLSPPHLPGTELGLKASNCCQSRCSHFHKDSQLGCWAKYSGQRLFLRVYFGKRGRFLGLVQRVLVPMAKNLQRISFPTTSFKIHSTTLFFSSNPIKLKSSCTQAELFFLCHSFQCYMPKRKPGSLNVLVYSYPQPVLTAWRATSSSLEGSPSSGDFFIVVRNRYFRLQ